MKTFSNDTIYRYVALKFDSFGQHYISSCALIVLYYHKEKGFQWNHNYIDTNEFDICLSTCNDQNSPLRICWWRRWWRLVGNVCCCIRLNLLLNTFPGKCKASLSVISFKRLTSCSLVFNCFTFSNRDMAEIVAPYIVQT